MRETEWETLSERQQEIVDLLMTGMTAKEIAEDLLISFHTVRTHIRTIYAILGIANRVELCQHVWHRASSSSAGSSPLPQDAS